MDLVVIKPLHSDPNELTGRAQLLPASSGLPSLGPERRPGMASVRELEQTIAGFYAGRDTDSVEKDLVRAIVLLWHDHLAESHSISQNIPTAEGSYVHGIMHRREPDYGNAGYWFRRVGKHPIFGKLAAVAGQKDWDPFAFIAAVEQARERHDVEAQRHLQSLQAEEMRLLLAHVMGGY
jgi:hypothetical protein